MSAAKGAVSLAGESPVREFRYAVASESAGCNSPCSSSWTFGPGTGATAATVRPCKRPTTAPLAIPIHRATSSGCRRPLRGVFLLTSRLGVLEANVEECRKLPRHTHALAERVRCCPGVGRSGSL